MTGKEIIIISESAKNINYTLPDNSYTNNKKFAKSISDAWRDATIIDQNGVLWICENKIHTIIRTTKENGKYFVSKVPNNQKTKIKNLNYVKGSYVLMEIDIRLQIASTVKSRNYLKFSSKNHEAIRDCNDVQLIALKVQQNKKEFIKTLKKKRIKEYKNKFNIAIKEDELTGEKLEKNAHFSHIRSCSLYPEVSDNVYNGHIINKSTHRIITEYNVNDEDELLRLCESLGWSTSWYKGYKKIFDLK